MGKQNGKAKICQIDCNALNNAIHQQGFRSTAALISKMEEYADNVKVTERAVNNWREGRQGNLRAVNLAALCWVLDLTISELMPSTRV